ncbi:MAG: FAD-dependent monooxygenase [Xanthobacteraceae bacterium]|nr:FAD-dependent monooxygenase [Xanthobacteraceae bacterium]
MTLRVVIIGAGIGGLAAAHALRLHGIEVDLYERASELGEVGAGLQIGPNAFKVLRALGLEDPLRRIAVEPAARIALNWNDASERSRIQLRGVALARFGAPFVTVHRADLHRVLRQDLDPRMIHLGCGCTRVETIRDGAVAHFADGSSVEADIVVGADGIRSVVREQLIGPDAPRFTNFVCWRCIVPIELMPERVGPGGAVNLARGDHISFYGPPGQVICYPIGDGSVLNIFAGRTSSSWVEESWTLPSSPAEMLQTYAGWNEALLGMLSKVEHCFKWGIFDREPTEVWTKGRITLLGDAAHPTMPNLAQGANMAIEDGIVLARNLTRHPGDIDAALEGYAAERKPRTRDVTLKSRENFDLTRRWPPAPPMSRDWIYDFDASRQP